MREKFLCESRVDFTRGTERRTAELHATLDNSCAITSGHPFERVAGKIGRRGRLGVLERNIVETQADLGIRGSSHLIQCTEVLYVSWREGFVGREAFEEDNYTKLRIRRRRDVENFNFFGSDCSFPSRMGQNLASLQRRTVRHPIARQDHRQTQQGSYHTTVPPEASDPRRKTKPGQSDP